MAAWLPIIKTAIPIIGEIVSVARPMFTEKIKNAERDELTTRQIEELQRAATQNSDSVKALAAQVQTTFKAMETAATELEKRMERQQRLTMAALLFGFLGFAVGIYLLAGAP
ncbi:MAG: hypothetical protein KJP03_02875 [Gammaproteobacteria bacterium]|nr:hypothetical protein [Gammaproteobacteria bacterium]